MAVDDAALEDGRTLSITATPARHGPAHSDRGPVVGFVLEIAGAGPEAIYVSGDTVWYEGVAEVARRFPVKVAVLFMGAAQVDAVVHGISPSPQKKRSKPPVYSPAPRSCRCTSRAGGISGSIGRISTALFARRALTTACRGSPPGSRASSNGENPADAARRIQLSSIVVVSRHWTLRRTAALPHYRTSHIAPHPAPPARRTPHQLLVTLSLDADTYRPAARGQSRLAQ